MKKIALYAILSAFAILAGYFETLFSIPAPVAGVKIGLGNIVVLVALCVCNLRCAAAVSATKVLLCALLFSNAFSLLYSASGALLSLIAMAAALHSRRVGVVGISIIGGVFHNMGQLCCAAFFVGASAFLYMPLLGAVGGICGALTGGVAAVIVKRMDGLI